MFVKLAAGGSPDVRPKGGDVRLVRVLTWGAWRRWGAPPWSRSDSTPDAPTGPLTAILGQVALLALVGCNEAGLIVREVPLEGPPPLELECRGARAGGYPDPSAGWYPHDAVDYSAWVATYQPRDWPGPPFEVACPRSEVDTLDVVACSIRYPDGYLEALPWSDDMTCLQVIPGGELEGEGGP